MVIAVVRQRGLTAVGGWGRATTSHSTLTTPAGDDEWQRLLDYRRLKASQRQGAPS